MALVTASRGDKTKLLKGAVHICGIDSMDLSWNGSTVDITNNCSVGFRELLDILGMQSQDISLSGKVVDGVLRALAFDASEVRQYTDFTIEYPNGDVLAFAGLNLESYSESNPTSEAITFSAALKSSGSWTYTAA